MKTENTYTVYKHIFPNGKIYVGMTAQKDLNRRWQSGYGYKGQRLMYRAIQHYGWDNIRHEIVRTGLSKDMAEALEIELIARYKSNDRAYGYNVDNGGNCVGTHSEETKRKIGQAQLGSKNRMYGKHTWSYGKKMPPEIVKKNRLSHIGIPAWNKGLPMSEEQKEKLRRPKTEEHKRKISEKKSMPVLCIETGIVYASGKDAEDKTGVSRGTISNVCRGICHTAGGFHWKRVKK